MRLYQSGAVDGEEPGVAINIRLLTQPFSLTLSLSKGEGKGRCRKTMRGDPVIGAWVYILECADGSYYVGSTRGDLADRIGTHNSGALGGYTSTRRPVKLVYADYFQRITDAIAAERQLKGWRRAKKEALIAGRFELLPELARTARNRPPRSTGSG